jgi:uncharacterized protein (DUF2336 family)
MSAYHTLLSALDGIIDHDAAERRATILRRIASLFVDGAENFSEQHIELFDSVFSRLIDEIETKARIELSLRLATVVNAPPRVILRLAQDDDICVAGPVLKQSGRIAENDLRDIAKSKDQEFLFAIADRKTVAEAVTDVIVRRGDREVVRHLAGNWSAKLSDYGLSLLVRKAATDGILAEIVGQRADLPRPLLRKLIVEATRIVQKRLFASANAQIKTEIMRVLAEISGEVESANIERDYTSARQIVSGIQCESKFDEAALVALASQGKYEEAVAGMSLLFDFPIEFIERLMANKRPDPILTMCKAAGFAWQTACAVISMAGTGRQGISMLSLEAARRAYVKLSPISAQQVVSFWHARHSVRPAAG